MSASVRHLTVEAVLAIHREVIVVHGGADGLRDRALLESAVAAPQAAMHGTPVCKDLVEMAAALLFYLCRNHPFVDGNKRVALASMVVFLVENGMPLPEVLDVDAWESFVIDVAASRLTREQATECLREWL